MNFDGKVVWVTGAGQGIGYEICRKFAHAGAFVALNDQNVHLAGHAAAAINRETHRQTVSAWPGDISDPATIASMVEDIQTRWGKLDILIANAGITVFGEFLGFAATDFDRLVNVNLRGTYFCAQAAALSMIKTQVPGRIVLMSSVTGVQAHRNLSAYGMTKAAIRMLARSLAMELGPHNITVNALGPGATLTERTESEGISFTEGWKAVAPNRKIATVADIAAAALFLASEEAHHITGETLMIDGGWTIHSPLPGDNYSIT
ncbi:MAG: SDR family NAD(P)-dependent oxidoreductase [Bacteroidia bacterium]|nr:SDR family NAD(P)-dependent oxidoreductase [Bacteroidia bacterium]